MATQMPTPNHMPTNPDTTFVTVKVAIDGTNRRFKLALRDLGANVFPTKLRFLLAIPPDAHLVLERYSDSAAAYVTLDSNNPAIYKQLYRAAKAKLKLRIKATVIDNAPERQNAQNSVDDARAKEMHSRSHYLETVLGHVPSTVETMNALMSETNFPNITSETLVAPPKTVDANIRGGSPLHDFPSALFCIDCNRCGNAIPNEHFHCSICDEGDFDLCMDCVANDVHCRGEDHWLIKRSLQNGKVVTSTTETIEPKHEKLAKSATETRPQPLAEPVTSVRGFAIERTCNSCINEYPNSEFVSCVNCEDFDLCHQCLLADGHGHDPSHAFVPLEPSDDSVINTLCRPGRGVEHMAICDGCDKRILGVRHKCLNCPDWDYCSDCVGQANSTHPGHRFAALYEPIAEIKAVQQVNYGIYCDGPLCSSKPRRTYIRGIRYKCAICHDLDFCANCEALPTQQHCRTHPVIKFKTPVSHVSVTTIGEKPDGEKMAHMGDRVPRVTSTPATRPVKTAATETTPVATSTNAATQVQTMVDFKPIPSSPAVKSPKPTELDARFVSDAVADGTVLLPDTTFTQVWTMTNPGPETWPSGCSVRFTGGDWMLNVDNKRPSNVSSIFEATETNVTEHPVHPGDSIDFKIVLKTPSKDGRIISYWRLKNAEGSAFGHKLWCDVSVRSAPADADARPTSSYVAPSIKEEFDEEVSKSQPTSTMIFPKLDKESPVSSIHQEVQGETTETATSEAGPRSPVDDLADDVETLELDEEDSDEGFLTDEEYDILDASDEEFLNEAHKSTK